MIWTYTDATKAVDEYLSAKLMETIRQNQSPVISQVSVTPCFEGDHHGIHREDGTQVSRGFQHVTGSTTVATHEDRPVSLKEVESAFADMGKSFAQNLSKDFWLSIDRDLTEAGRVTKAGPITPDSIMDMWEGMWFEFTADGRPEWPSIVAGNEMMVKLQAAMAELQASPIHLKRLEGIVRKKRDEWSDREDRKYLAE